MIVNVYVLWDTVADRPHNTRLIIDHNDKTASRSFTAMLADPDFEKNAQIPKKDVALYQVGKYDEEKYILIGIDKPKKVPIDLSE